MRSARLPIVIDRRSLLKKSCEHISLIWSEIQTQTCIRQQFADAAVDNAIQNLYTSAASSDQFIGSDTVIPGSQPDEKPDEVIEGWKGLQHSTHSPSSNTGDEGEIPRGPVCPTATSDDCHCVWKCARLSDPEWSNTEWPTMAKLQQLKFILKGLVCHLRMEPPGTEVTLEAANF